MILSLLLYDLLTNDISSGEQRERGETLREQWSA